MILIAAIEMADYQNRLFSSTRRQYYWKYEIAAHMNLGDSFTDEIAPKSFWHVCRTDLTVSKIIASKFKQSEDFSSKHTRNGFFIKFLF